MGVLYHTQQSSWTWTWKTITQVSKGYYSFLKYSKEVQNGLVTGVKELPRRRFPQYWHRVRVRKV